MKRLFTLLFLSFFALGAYAQNFVSTTAENKNVVLEEFTGIYCGFCPDGHRLGSLLATNNPGDVFLINVHAGGYANPNGNDPDFRTPFGAAIDGQSGLAGYPAGTINRRNFPGLEQGSAGATAMSRGDWATAAAQVVAEPSSVNVAAQATVDITTRELKVVVETYYTGNASASTHKLNVALTQDNVEGPQSGASANPSQVLANGNYNHQHMLRHLLTGQWGMDITTTTMGHFQADTFTYTLPADINGVDLSVFDLDVVVFLAEGQQTIVTGNATAVTPITSIPNEVAMLSYDGDDVICGTTPANASVTVQNLGVNAVTSLTIDVKDGSTVVATQNWTGSIASMQTEVISLGTLSPSSTTNYTFEVSSAADADASNNSVDYTVNVAPVSGSDVYTLVINTDNYGGETYWQVRDAQNIAWASGGNAAVGIDGGGQGQPQGSTGYGNNTTVTETINLPADGCYELVMVDAYGDGICCGFGNGSYSFTDDVGNVLAQGSDFGATDESPFEAQTFAVSVEDVASISGLNIFPNPATTTLNVQFAMKNSEELNVSVMNALGQVVKVVNTGLLDAGSQNLTVNTNEMAAGMYFLSFTNGAQTTTKRFVVAK